MPEFNSSCTALNKSISNTVSVDVVSASACNCSVKTFPLSLKNTLCDFLTGTKGVHVIVLAGEGGALVSKDAASINAEFLHISGVRTLTWYSHVATS